MSVQFKQGKIVTRTILAAVGMFLCGVAVAFFKLANLGLDPYQCFANGIARLIPISFGTLYMLINLIQLIVVFFLDKHYIGISTFLNLFLVGYAADFTEMLLRKFITPDGIVTSLILMAIALIISCIAAALYYTAELGVSTYDAIPLHIADCKPHLFGHIIPFKYVRVISDFICVLIGIIMGLLPGIGTILTAFFMGPLITFFKNTISDPILAKATK